MSFLGSGHLSDVNYKALGDRGFDMLCDYVEQGGNLLLTGGPYAFGNGEFEGARFLEVLPVTLSGPFDLKWAGKGKSWALTPAQKGSPVLEGVSFAEDPGSSRFLASLRNAEEEGPGRAESRRPAGTRRGASRERSSRSSDPEPHGRRGRGGDRVVGLGRVGSPRAEHLQFSQRCEIEPVDCLNRSKVARRPSCDT